MSENPLDESQKLNDVLISLKKALSDKEEKGQFTEVELLLEKIAKIYQTQGYWHKALKHYHLLVKVKTEANRPPDELAKANHNVGEVYEILKDDRSESLYLQSLELANNPLLIAQCVIDVARIKFKLGSLQSNDLFISKFPKNQIPLNYMLNAILAESEGFKNMAGDFYGRAAISESLEFGYREKCYEELIKISLVHIMKSFTNVTVHTLKSRLEKWELLSNDFNLKASLCKIYLLQCKLAQITNNYSEAKLIVKKCNTIADLAGLPLHQKLAIQELNKIEHQSKIIANSSPNSQASYKQQLFQEFSTILVDFAQLLISQD